MNYFKKKTNEDFDEEDYTTRPMRPARNAVRRKCGARKDHKQHI